MHPSFSFRERPAYMTAVSPNWGVNSALALIEAAEPRNEIEGALALQMACTHIASMAILANFGGYATERRTGLFASAAARLMRTLCCPGRGFTASAPGRLPV